MKGILMTPDNHKATRELRKTQTRRVIQPQPRIHTVATGITHGTWQVKPSETILWSSQPNIDCIKRDMPKYARYKIGETVYIKEAWAIKHDSQSFSPKLDDIVRIIFNDGEIERRYGDISYNPIGRWLSSVSKAYDTGEWQSPMFLPELCARDFILITDVKSERLQEITAQDAIAEGIKSRAEEWVYEEANGNRHLLDFTTPSYKRYDGKGDGETRCPQLSFCTLWDSINGKTYPWSSNPWVWPYTYKLLEGKSE